MTDMESPTIESIQADLSKDRQIFINSLEHIRDRLKDQIDTQINVLQWSFIDRLSERIRQIESLEVSIPEDPPINEEPIADDPPEDDHEWFVVSDTSEWTKAAYDDRIQFVEINIDNILRSLPKMENKNIRFARDCSVENRGPYGTILKYTRPGDYAAELNGKTITGNGSTFVWIDADECNVSALDGVIKGFDTCFECRKAASVKINDVVGNDIGRYFAFITSSVYDLDVNNVEFRHAPNGEEHGIRTYAKRFRIRNVICSDPRQSPKTSIWVCRCAEGVIEDVDANARIRVGPNFLEAASYRARNVHIANVRFDDSATLEIMEGTEDYRLKNIASERTPTVTHGWSDATKNNPGYVEKPAPTGTWSEVPGGVKPYQET